MSTSASEAPSVRSLKKYRVTKRATTSATRHGRRVRTAGQQPDFAQELSKENGVLLPRSEEHQLRQGKRCEPEESQDAAHEVPAYKRRRHSAEEKQCNPDAPVVSHDELVRAWVCNDSEWSETLRNTTTMSDRNPRPLKRLLSLSSIGRTGSSGGSRDWWGNRHAEEMCDGGLIMEEREGITCTQESLNLCTRLLACDDQLPDDWYLKESECREILIAASYKNEQRVERDVPPIICPSSELLSIRGYSDLEHIKEGLNAEWTACTSLFGPKPKPDGCYGISRHALTRTENEKLSFSTIAECEGSIFQFIVRQAKRSDGSLMKAERQAMHNASVACNTLVELYEAIGAAEELDRQILAFSMTHNHATVKIFAHFPIISADNKTFHRRLLHTADLLSLSSDWSKPYRIILGIFKHFYPLHLNRIKGALARRPDHSIGTFTAQLSVDRVGQEEISNPPSSQAGSQSLSSLVRLGEENEKLRVQILGLIKWQRELADQQKEEARQQREEFQQQLAQQQETIGELLQGKK